jgi:hypothetical protein
MALYHDVLVPLDGSSFGEQATATAAAIAGVNSRFGTARSIR